MEEARLHELRLANCLQKYLDHQTMYRKLQPAANVTCIPKPELELQPAIIEALLSLCMQLPGKEGISVPGIVEECEGHRSGRGLGGSGGRE
jgi:hypothetical protein